MVESVRAVLVTGGAGYVAPPVVRRLAESGRPVVVLDDFSTGHREFVKWGTLVEGDVGDAALLSKTMRAHGVGAVMHFAAKAQVGESVEKPELYDRWNRGRRRSWPTSPLPRGVGAIVFSHVRRVWQSRRTCRFPRIIRARRSIPYGTSKVGCEDALFASGVPTAALRYFNAAGGEPEHGLGERHDPETHLIPLALRAVETGQPLRIFGTDYPTPDGTWCATTST